MLQNENHKQRPSMYTKVRNLASPSLNSKNNPKATPSYPPNQQPRAIYLHTRKPAESSSGRNRVQHIYRGSDESRKIGAWRGRHYTRPAEGIQSCSLARTALRRDVSRGTLYAQERVLITASARVHIGEPLIDQRRKWSAHK